MVFALALLFTGSSLFAQLPGYNFYKILSLKSAKVSGSGSHIDFPVLISHIDADLSTVGNGGDVENINGYDIQFTADDGTTLLDHEIEAYNPVTGEIAMWVRIPLLSTSINTAIRIYYGNAAISTNQSTSSTWGAGHAAVYHLNNGLIDATSNGNTLTNLGSTNANSGLVADCRDFDTNEAVETGANASIQIIGDLTVTCWIDFNAIQGGIYDNCLISAGGTGTSLATNHLYYMNVESDGRLRLSWEYGAGSNVEDHPSVNSSIFTSAGFSMLSATRNTTTNEVYFYQNGELLDLTGQVYANQASGGTSAQLRLGQNQENSTLDFDGLMDEVRIQDVVRSSDWLLTEYNTVSSPNTFYTIGTATSVCSTLFVDAGSNQSGCIGSSITLGATPVASGGTTPYAYQWSNGGSLSSSTIEQPVANPTITTAYVITVTDGSGTCQSTSSVTVTINPQPTPIVTGVTQVCAGYSASLTATGGMSYSWSTGESVANITVTPGASTNYNVTVTDANTCSASGAISVTVNSLPIVTIVGNTTICDGLSTTLTAAGGVDYLWSTGDVIANPVFSPAANTTYKVTVTDANGCVSGATQIVVVDAIPVAGTASGAITICSGNATNISVTGYTGDILWQASSAGGGSWGVVSGGNASVINVVPLADMDYRTQISNGVCVPVYSNLVTIIVDSISDAGVISSAAVLCPSSNSGTLDLTGSVGSILDWEWSTDNFVTTNSLSNTTSSHDYSNLDETTQYRSIVANGVCLNDTTGTLILTVQPDISSNTIATSQTLCSGSSPTPVVGSVPVGGNSTYLYLWEESMDAVAWTNAQGSNTQQNYSPGALSTTIYYRRLVESGQCIGVTQNISNNVIITVIPDISGDSITDDQNICEGEPVAALNGSGPVGGDGSYSYIWLSSLDGTNWDTVPAITSQNYPSPSVSETTFFQRNTSSNVCSGPNSSNGNMLTINVTPVIVDNFIDSSQTVCGGDVPNPLIGAVPSGGNSIYSYAWESSNDALIWSFTGATTLNYSPPSLTVTTFYRRVIESQYCTSNSASYSGYISIEVDAPLGNNNLYSDQIICGGETPSGFTASVPNGGTGLYTYQWESTLDTMAIWTPVAGNGTTPFYNSGPLADTTYFRRIVASGACTGGSSSSTSNTLTVTVLAALDQNTISAAQVICEGMSPSLLVGSYPNGGNGQFTYQWQSRSVNNGIWMTAGVVDTVQSYAPSALLDSTYFRRVVTSQSCTGSFSHFSDSILIAVHPSIQSNMITGPGGVCRNQNPDSLFGSVPTGGDGSYTFSWEQFDGTNWVTASGNALGENYYSGPLVDTALYRRIVESGVCVGIDGGDTSLVHVLNVPPVPVANLVHIDTTCLNSGSEDLSTMVNLQAWETVSFTAIGGLVINGNSNLNYNNSGPGTHQLYYQVSNQYCSVDSVITLVFLPNYQANFSNPDTLCEAIGSFQLWTLLSGSSDPGGTWSGMGITDSTLTLAGLDGDYDITYSVGYPACEEIKTKTIHIEPDVDPSWAAPGPYCNDNDTIDLFQFCEEIGGVFGGPALTGFSNFDVGAAQAGWNEIVYLIPNGACSESYADSILVYDEPWVDAGELDSVCDLSYGLMASSNAVQVNWSGSGVFSNELSVSSNVQVSVYGTYNFEITASQPGGCVLSDSVSVIFQESIPNFILQSDTFLFNQYEFDVSNPINLPGSGEWGVSQGDADIIFSNDSTTSFQNLSLGENTLSWKQNNGSCAMVSNSFILQVFEMDIPTGFSPNGDGVNDLLVFQGLQNELIKELSLFNRWGNLIYESQNYQNDWDGTLNGQSLPNDTYFYVLLLRNETVVKGFFELKQ